MEKKEITKVKVVKEGKSLMNTLHAFQFTDLTIQIGNEKLYVNREQLTTVSPVFKVMLTGDFKEKNASEIELPDKDPTAFSHFLRYTLPGFSGLNLTEKIARLILPLAHEYQTETSLLKIDEELAKCMNEKEYLSPDEIIGEILNAELYTLSKYLTACIEKASKLKYDTLIRRPKFQNISADTKANIFWTKCEKLELGTENCLQVFKTSSKFGGFCSDCAQGRKVVDEAKHMLNAMSWS